MKHTWIKNLAPNASKTCPGLEQIEAMRDFHRKSQWQKNALQSIAYNMAERDIMHLAEVFVKLDQNNDGSVTFRELAEGAKRVLGKNDGHAELQELMCEMDVDGDGSINYTEFLA